MAFQTVSMPAFIAIAVLVGLIAGSFFTVCIHRYLVGESIIRPRSHCPECLRQLGISELIPVLSYLWLRGRCSSCKKPLSPLYPLVELISGLVAGLLAWRFGPGVPFLVAFVFCGVLIVLSGIDILVFEVPDFLSLGGAVVAVPAAVYGSGLSWTASLSGAAIGAGSFWCILLLFKWIRGLDGLGLGDVKLMLLIGALSGPLALPFITLVAGVSGMLATFLVALFMPSRRASLRETPIPFVPFLSSGFFIYLLCGKEVLYWWLF